MAKEFFRILAPFTRIADIKLLKESGADELYCGYITKELAKKWPAAFCILNRRGEAQSFEDYSTFQRAVELAHNLTLPVYVTINGLYTPEQYPLLLKLTEKIERLQGVNGIIVADLGFLLTLKKNGFNKEIHISVGGTCFNSNTADFFSSLGADRMILERQLASHEIEDIFKEMKTPIGIEVFIMAEGCGGFIDGYCTFFHCVEKNIKARIRKGDSVYPASYSDQDYKGCQFYFANKLAHGDFRIFDAKTCKEKEIRLKFQRKKYNLFGCRICDLYDLRKYPLKSLKVIGRGKYPVYTARLVKVVAQALSWLTSDTISRNDYQQKCKKLFSATLLGERKCTKFDCYFSSHWLKNDM